MAQTNFNISQVESPVYTASTTGTDTYTATLVPTPTSLVTGQKVRIKFTTANTGACSLNLNSLWAVNIKTQAGNDPADGDIAAASIRELTYDGTNFVLNVNRATTAEQGIVEMATDAEALAWTDEVRYINAKQAKDNYGGSPKSIIATRDLTAAGWSVNYAHWLGATPKYIRITALWSNSIQTNRNMIVWTYDWTNTRSVWWVQEYSSWNALPYSSTTTILFLWEVAWTWSYQTATAVFDSTNVTLTWTKNGSPTWTCNMLIEAFP